MPFKDIMRRERAFIKLCWRDGDCRHREESANRNQKLVAVKASARCDDAGARPSWEAMLDRQQYIIADEAEH